MIDNNLLHGFFFFNHPATTEIYPLSLHDALPISPLRRLDLPRERTLAGARQAPGLRANGPPLGRGGRRGARVRASPPRRERVEVSVRGAEVEPRSEEHTSELQSQSNLVCRLLLDK